MAVAAGMSRSGNRGWIGISIATVLTAARPTMTVTNCARRVRSASAIVMGTTSITTTIATIIGAKRQQNGKGKQEWAGPLSAVRPILSLEERPAKPNSGKL